MEANGQFTMFDYLERESNERIVRRISYNDTKPFLLGIHYARRMPNITDAFGLFIGGDLVGVVTYGIPASLPLCIGLAGRENKDRVKELNRLVIKPEWGGAQQRFIPCLSLIKNARKRHVCSELRGHGLVSCWLHLSSDKLSLHGSFRKENGHLST